MNITLRGQNSFYINRTLFTYMVERGFEVKLCQEMENFEIHAWEKASDFKPEVSKI